MNSRRKQILSFQLFDGIFILLFSFLFSFLEGGMKGFFSFPLLLFPSLFIPSFLGFLGFYRLHKADYFSTFRLLLLAFGISGLLVAWGFLLTNSSFFSPNFYILSSSSSAAFLFLHFRFFSKLRKREVLLIGKNSVVENFVEKSPNFREENSFSQISSFSHSLQDLEKLLKEKNIEGVFLILSDEEEKFTEVINLCGIFGVNIWIVNLVSPSRFSQVSLDFLDGCPILNIRTTQEGRLAYFCKEIFDKIGALFLLFLTFPLWIFAGIGILFSSSGPIFFVQNRSGRYGKSFQIFKFRTMNIDAEENLEEVKKTFGNEMDGPVFKLKKDPRVFRFGKLLRKWSIDELPQLINILKGDMSLVGPRPLPVYEVSNENFKREHFRRLSMKPGITCYWQISGRSEISNFQEWVELDLKYIDEWSFFRDIKILIRTLFSVIICRGAK